MAELLWPIVFVSGGLLIGLSIGWLVGSFRIRTVISNFTQDVRRIVDRVAQIENRLSNAYSAFSQISSNKVKTEAELRQELRYVGDRLLSIADRVEVRSTTIQSSSINPVSTRPPVVSRDEHQHLEVTEPPAPLQEKIELSNRSDFDRDVERPSSRDISYEIADLYNRAAADRSARDTFRASFSVVRIGNIQAIAQRVGSSSDPKFRELDNGNFLAVEVGEGRFLVVPQFDTSIDASAFNEGGFGFAFDCSGYSPELVFTRFQLVRPAVFCYENSEWLKIDQGKLILHHTD